MEKKTKDIESNVYYQARKRNGLTREKASELMDTISESRLERIEYGTANALPEDVVEMAAAYNQPSLCNYYCSHECRIGQDNVPEIQESTLPEIVLRMLATLNELDEEKNRLIFITADGKVSDDELRDFARIQRELEKVSVGVESLKLWVNRTIAEGDIDIEKLQNYQKELD